MTSRPPEHLLEIPTPSEFDHAFRRRRDLRKSRRRHGAALRVGAQSRAPWRRGRTWIGDPPASSIKSFEQPFPLPPISRFFLAGEEAHIDAR
jgi:hypothetical protein